MTDKIKPGTVILIGIDPADGKPTPEMEIFDDMTSAMIAIHTDAISYDAFYAIRLGKNGNWSSCWELLRCHIELLDE